jgi:AcrR family transcriptional regulator
MNCKDKIIKAAINVFAQKGVHGARMEEIALSAKVNKAMVYYFFSTKENLYIEVLTFIIQEIFLQIFDGIKKFTKEKANPKERIKTIVKSYFYAFSKNMEYTKLVTGTMLNDPQKIKIALEHIRKGDLLVKHRELREKLLEFFNTNIKNKTFRNVDPRQTMISIVGMSLIYFISQPISQVLFENCCLNEKKFLDQRLNSVIDLVSYGIIENKNSKILSRGGF